MERGQVAAFGMAVFLRGMGRDECVALTNAMMHSGRVMTWPAMPGPVLDKHSSGGVGDKGQPDAGPWSPPAAAMCP